MNILYISQYFPPEMGAPSARVSEVSRCWVGAGHHVTVLTGFPNHPTGVVAPEYRSRFFKGVCRETVDGINVVRSILVPLPNAKSWERMINYSSFCASAAVTGSFLGRHDVVIATSPQLLVGLSGLAVSRATRAPFVFEVRDLWPESLIAVGTTNERSPLYRVLRRVARVLYTLSSHIVVVSPAFKEHLVREWQISPDKISTVMNGVDIELFRPGGPVIDSLNGQNLRGRFVVSYVGTMGNAHGLGTLIEAAKCVAQLRPDVLFLLVGEGAEKRAISEQIRKKEITNVIVVGQQPRATLPALIRASDVCLVMLKNSPVFKTVIPTKTLEFMAAGRPLLAAVDGQARKLVEDAGAGLCIEPENANALVNAVLTFAERSDLRSEMGRNGRSYIERHLVREQTAAEYLSCLQAVVYPNLRQPIQETAIRRAA